MVYALGAAGLAVRSQGYVSGQTMCLRRDTLQAIGGLQAIANHLADDHRLGELVRGLGLTDRAVALSWSRAEHHEPTLDFARSGMSCAGCAPYACCARVVFG